MKRTKKSEPIVVCAYCGETIEDPDEAANPRMIDGEIICERSWRDNFAFECCVCENWEENDLQRMHVVVIDAKEAFGDELGPDGKYRVRQPRGVYQVLSDIETNDEREIEYDLKRAERDLSERPWEKCS